MTTLEEQKANRKLWVDALRSGKYEQGQGQLKTTDGRMCCLGVLADIAGCVWSSNGEYQTADGKWAYAPARAMEFVGLATDSGRSAVGPLSHNNDRGASFSDIADIIESEPDGLFVSPQ